MIDVADRHMVASIVGDPPVLILLPRLLEDFKEDMGGLES